MFSLKCIIFILFLGTTERVCLISGGSDAIMAVLTFIMEKIREKPEHGKPQSDIDNKSMAERDRQVCNVLYLSSLF